MKTMKQIAVAALLTIGAFSAVTYTSCSKDSDKCANVVCDNGGTCSGGTCVCPTGYGGTLCDALWKTAFIGTWTANEPGHSAYQVTITGGSSITELLVGNIGDYGCGVTGNNTYTATITSGTSFTIGDTECGTLMSTTATLNADGSITVPYTATYTSTTTGQQVVESFTATLTK